MSPTKHETLTAPVSIDFDAEKMTGSAKAGDIAETTVKPIANIVSGEPHSVSIKLPNGFEYAEAHVASGSTVTHQGAIRLEKNSDTHTHVKQDIPQALEAAGFQGLLLPVTGALPGIPALIAAGIRAAALDQTAAR